MKRSRTSAAVLLVLVLTGCGSTVQAAGSRLSVMGDGLAPDVAASAAASGPSAPPDAAQAGTTTPTSDGATVAAEPVAPASASAAVDAPGTSVVIPGSADTTPILVGISYFDVAQQNTFTGAFGEGLQTADRKAIAQLLIDDLNKRGGILGHPVKPVFHKNDVNGQRATEEEAACQDFTQDHKVQVVFVAELNDESYLRCLARKGVGAIDPTYARLSEPDFGRFNGLLYPSGIALDRLAKVKAEQLTAQGFFRGKNVKAGIIYYDEPRFIKGANDLKAALVAKGIAVPDMTAVHYPQSTADASTTASDSQSAELHFAADGVTHVLAVEDGIPEGVFAIAADKQGYRPRFSWDSGQSLVNVAGLVPKAALTGSQFVGWFPAVDVADAKLMPATTQSCFTFLAKHQQSATTGNQRLTAISECENVAFMAAAYAASGGDFSAAGLLKGAYALAHYAPSATFSERLSSTRRDGVASVRMGSYQGPCSCFAYTTGPIALR